eukprot:CAMPEP_0119431724 /NCGR_PEP_ID=MMETSP1335-20130426/46470_1 /TAXON_ID=259385 /ORGANISM="Chrysoculter rhomboideus, Strain RCC1486" /LENGTH=35 /DNA_ID= /DNA_START= /DNA_END= /DNA_ORIENTATION=
MTALADATRDIRPEHIDPSGRRTAWRSSESGHAAA